MTPAVEYFKGIPVRVEDSILKLEKRAKAIENDSRGMSSFEKGIQDLLRDSWRHYQTISMVELLTFEVFSETSY